MALLRIDKNVTFFNFHQDGVGLPRDFPPKTPAITHSTEKMNDEEETQMCKVIIIFLRSAIVNFCLGWTNIFLLLHADNHMLPSSAQASAQLSRAKLALILKYPEKLPSKLIFGMHAF